MLGLEGLAAAVGGHLHNINVVLIVCGSRQDDDKVFVDVSRYLRRPFFAMDGTAFVVARIGDRIRLSLPNVPATGCCRLERRLQ